MSITLEKKQLRGSLLDREERILAYASGKTVLHLGCSDYPYSLEQYKQGNLLHDKLHTVSKSLVGVDISTRGY